MQSTQEKNRPKICLVGLGNPGAKYTGTRHNIGFEWIIALAESGIFGNRLQFKEKFESKWCQTHFEDHEVHLLMPLTFMNESGRALADWKSKHQGETRILVAFDEMDLPIGRLRLRGKGSDGGHRGLRSLLERVPNEEIFRLRIGIGRPPEGEPLDHVLGKFKPEDKEVMRKVLADAPEHFKIWLGGKLENAMNKINGKSYSETGESDGA